MTMPISKSPSTLTWITAIAVVTFGGIGVAAFMGLIPTSFGPSSAVPKVTVAAAQPAQKTHAPVAAGSPGRVICDECGVIESIRIINHDGTTGGLDAVGLDAVDGAMGGAKAGNAMENNTASTRSYAVTVRFDNGSSRVFNEINSPTWQMGDHIRIVDGTIRSDG